MSKETVQDALLNEIFGGDDSPAQKVAGDFDVSRQTVSKYLRDLVNQGVIKKKGTGRSTKYELVVQKKEQTMPITAKLAEHQVWEELTSGFLDHLSENERRICEHGFTEMVNNAIDHSEGNELSVLVSKTARYVLLIVKDNGVGIFNKITKALGLVDPRQSILELSKGKFTTDPARHSGEGIFFTSRMFDVFSILSDDSALVHADLHDWFVELQAPKLAGTSVVMNLVLPSTRTTKEIFDQFSSGPDNYSFARTHVPLSLARYGLDELVSRSQARRVLARVDRFEKVSLDFTGVDYIGQAFADEIFRVFKNQNPQIKLVFVGASEEVTKMIQRALTHVSE